MNMFLCLCMWAVLALFSYLLNFDNIMSIAIYYQYVDPTFPEMEYAIVWLDIFFSVIVISLKVYSHEIRADTGNHCYIG